MSRSPISYILNLGKHRPVKLAPVKQLSAEVENASALLRTPPIARKTPVKAEQVQHTNQMSS